MLYSFFILAPVSAAEPGDTTSRVTVKESELGVFDVGDTIAPSWTVIQRLLLNRWLVVEGPCGTHRCLKELVADSRVEFAEFDSLIEPVEASTEPMFPEQWALENLPSRGGHFDVDIDAQTAWSTGANGAGIIVAVLDTGVDIYHNELTDQIWTNLLEIPNNGVDDDENGFIDDVRGGNSVWRDGNVNDADGHGTACAGLIAASINDTGMVGIAPEAQIMPVRIFGKGEEGSFVSHAADGIIYAVDQGANVLSNSWTSGTGKKQLITEAIEYANDNNVLFVASAGNSPVDADTEGFFPASSGKPNVISVAASDRFGDLVDHPAIWGSTFGLNSVDLSAPGDAVLSTWPDNEYIEFAGTSAAAPLVAGVAALVWSKRPDLKEVEVKDILLGSVEPAQMPTVTGGRLNAGNALRLLDFDLLPFSPNIEVLEHHATDGTPTLLSVTNASQCEWYFPDTESLILGTTVEYQFLTPGSWIVVSVCENAAGQTGRSEIAVELEIPWTEYDFVPIESQHERVTNGQREINLPAGTEWARFHFERIDLSPPKPYQAKAYVALYDEHDAWVWSIDGQHDDLWTPPLRGSTYTLYWSIDESSSSSWGFHLDRAQHWSRPLPIPFEVSPTFPVSLVESSNASCATAPVHKLWLWLLALLSLRQRRR